MPAGSVLGVILIALGIAALFNEAIVRAGESMQPGHTGRRCRSGGRSTTWPGRSGSTCPARLDLAFGQESKTAKGTELEQGSTAILRAKRRKRKPRGSPSRPSRTR